MLENLDSKLRNMKYYIVLLLSIALNQIGLAQTTNVQQVQPTIIVVPYTKSGENALAKYEAEFSYRTAVTEISNALNERGFRPENLQESINALKESEAISSLKGVTFDPVQKILNNSTADFVIKAEIYIFSENELNSVQIRLTALEKSSNNVMYDMNFKPSPGFKTTDYGYLAKRTLNQDGQLETFVNGLNKSFTDIKENGKAIKVLIETTSSTKYGLEDEINGDYLSDLIIEWVKKNAYKNNYRIKTNSANMLHFDEIRIPLRNADGTNYDVNDFSKELRKAVLEICAKKDGQRPKIDKPIVNSGTIRLIMP